MAVCWLVIIYPIQSAALLKDYGGNLTGLVAVSICVSIPLGYFLVSFQHVLYYSLQKSVGIHTLSSNADIQSEKNAEVDVILQMVYSEWDIEKEKFIQEWFRKRFDVLIINNSVLLASALIIVFLMVAIINDCALFCDIWWILLIWGILLTVISHYSWILHSQAVRLVRGYYEELEKQQKPNNN